MVIRLTLVVNGPEQGPTPAYVWGEEWDLRAESDVFAQRLSGPGEWGNASFDRIEPGT